MYLILLVLVRSVKVPVVQIGDLNLEFKISSLEL